MSGTKPTKKQKLVDSDKYKEFLASSTKSEEGVTSKFNIFDDSNNKDKEWLLIARHYLSKKSGQLK
jgi:hypothetical protein